jgi:hypothetical protein
MDLMYQGIANNRISLAPLSVTQGVIQEGKIKPLVLGSKPNTPSSLIIGASFNIVFNSLI